MHKRQIRILLLFAVTSAALLSGAAAAAGGGYVTDNWNTSEGLPSASVRALAVGSGGYLWIGTASGLARFDGVSFRVFDQWNTPVINDSRILSIFAGQDGKMWVGTDGGGVFILDNGRPRPFAHGAKLLDRHIRAITGGPEGTLWIGTEFGLWRFRGDSWSLFGLDEGLPGALVTSLARDAAGRLWAGMMWEGLACFGEGLIRVYGEDAGFEDLSVLSLFAGAGGDLWIGTMSGLYVLRPGSASIRAVPAAQSYPVTALGDAPGGMILAGTMTEGIKLIGGSSLMDLEAGKGLGESYVRAVLAQEDGSVWAGTDLRGLFRVKKAAVVPLDGSDGLSDRSVYPILGDGRGGLWVGTAKSGLARITGGKVVEVKGRSEGLAGNMVRALSIDRFGRLWAGTLDGGLSVITSGKDGIINITRENGLPSDNVEAILHDGSGRVWIGTDRGLCFGAAEAAGKAAPARAGAREAGGKHGTSSGMDSAASPEGLKLKAVRELDGRSVRVLYEARDGSIIAGTRGGLWRLAPGLTGTAEGPDSASGSPHGYRGAAAGVRAASGGKSVPVFERCGGDSASAGMDIISVYEDGRGVLWAGTNGNGLCRLSAVASADSSSVAEASFTSRDGLPGDFIYSITGDGSGRMWMSCEEGVFAISADSLDAYARGASPVIAPLTYDESDGMPSRRSGGPCSPAVARSAGGGFIYPTGEGIVVIDPSSTGNASSSAAGDGPAAADSLAAGDSTVTTLTPPLPVIESLIAGGRAVWGDSAGTDIGRIRLPAGTARIEIRFTAIDWAAPEKCRFLYKLTGHDEGYSRLLPGRPRAAVYDDLPPGRYVFRLRAVGNGGRWSSKEAALVFTIRPPFYRNARLIAFVATLIGAAASAAAAVRKRRAAKAAGEKYSTSTITEERMDSAEEELRVLIEEEKVYLDPDLNLKKLARRLNIHYNHLSRIVNERFGMSFSNYINSLRIEEAKRLLDDPSLSRRTILQIMLDSGFYSKSTFNSAFRKFAGKSPSDYRKNR